MKRPVVNIHWMVTGWLKIIWIFTSGTTLLRSIDLWRISPASEAPVPSVKCQAFTSSHQQSLSCTIIQNPHVICHRHLTRRDGTYSSEIYSWRSVWQSVWQSVWWSVWKTCPLNLSANCLLCSMFLYTVTWKTSQRNSQPTPWGHGMPDSSESVLLKCSRIFFIQVLKFLK